jgi:D-alanyl-D-alanine carboxypeptidase
VPPDRPENSAEDERRPAPASAQDEAADDASGRGWMIQIGAPENLAKANALLTRAQERNRSTLASAKPLTEKVRKGDLTLYRARFAVLDSASAEAACRSLKRNGFSCFPAHD